MELSKTEQIKSLISKLLPQFHIDNAEIEIHNATNPGQSYTGSIYRIKIKGYDKLKKQTQLALILKTAASDILYRNLFHVVPLYQREIYFYTTVKPELIAMQKEKNIGNLFVPFPKHYTSSLIYLEEHLLMEDLKEKNCNVRDHQLPADYASAWLVMKNLGRLHALSYAIKNNKPDVYKQLELNLKGNVYSIPTLIEMAQKVVLDLSSQIISNCEIGEELIAESIKEFSEKFPLFYTRLLQDSSNYDVICHGDCTLRNMMFKYGSGSSIEFPEECYMTDMQLARIASPAYDLLYFLFLSTDKNVRSIHYNNLINKYYRSFSKFLNKLGGDPEESLPFSVLQEHLKKFAPFGLYIAMCLGSLHYRSASEVPEQDGLSEKSFNESFTVINDNRYFVRMKELVSDMIDLEYKFSW